jgi:hypothetical protein
MFKEIDGKLPKFELFFMKHFVRERPICPESFVGLPTVQHSTNERTIGF